MYIVTCKPGCLCRGSYGVSVKVIPPAGTTKVYFPAGNVMTVGAGGAVTTNGKVYVAETTALGTYPKPAA